MPVLQHRDPGSGDPRRAPPVAFVEAGVPVTINSDDPPMFGTTLNDEYAIAAELLSLSRDGMADLSRAAVRASFAPDDVKTRILGEIDDYERTAD
ncbi:hypothetical protein [Nocardioides sp. B-3]|uniref:hypothetical protein n=1 Tax=Nocardioides sp. B-3 TaxID=2895565 RepID=UPI002152182C|nr:hypothetical protein [Nocardioides sp. B-3]